VGVASLSKAITGVCIVKLVEAHKLQFDADLGTVLAGRFKRHPAKDQRAQTITIAQLLTHTSGITNDPSQGIAFNQFQPFDSRPWTSSSMWRFRSRSVTRPALDIPTTT
jgi:CubicO group peptidase (beta-lactamase class C family)